MWKLLYKLFWILAAVAFCVLSYLLIMEFIQIRTEVYRPLDLERHVMPAPEKAQFRKLLIKHGLQDGRTLICDWSTKPWFIRDGKRCSFK